MSSIVSLLPQSRFIQSHVTLPIGLLVTFLTDYRPEAIIEAAHGADGLFMPPSHPHLDAQLLEKMPTVRMIQTAGAGFDCVDTNAATRLGIVVCNSPAQNALTVAEYVLGVIICLQRELLVADLAIKKGDYVPAREAILSRGCLELSGATAGIVGLGAIGRTLATYFKALGATVLAHDVSWPEAFAQEQGIRRVELDELFAASDVVSLHCPLMDSTRGLVNAARLAAMKPEAVLINAARGGIVVEKDLADALERRVIRGAAIDNFAQELPAADNPLLNLSLEAQGRVLFTPHLAGVTRAAFSRMLRQGMENLEQVLVQKSPPRFVITQCASLRHAVQDKEKTL